MSRYGLPTPPGRRSSGFSLDEATSLRRMMQGQARQVPCPACGATITPTVGGAAGERIYLLRCPRCARGLVIHGASQESAIR